MEALLPGGGAGQGWLSVTDPGTETEARHCACVRTPIQAASLHNNCHGCSCILPKGPHDLAACCTCL
jgi:hypothetical protein